jgi:alpha-beta hydrolase superfamily lysophospholipase
VTAAPAPTPIWFGPDDRPLFGWRHDPAGGRAVGAVVLCPPMGREYMGTHRTFRMLAQSLASAGLVALRFDYDGTGDSAGRMLDDDRVEAWIASAAAALREMRQVGAPRLALVGMRLGALLATAAAAREGGVDDLVLWDPSRSGQRFLREQQALGLLSGEMALYGDDLPADWVDVPSWVFSDQTVADLRGLDVVKSGPVQASRTLILARADRPDDPKLVSAFSGPDVTWVEATDQAALIDAQTSQNAVPGVAIEAVSRWLADGTKASAPVELGAVESEPDPRRVAPGVTERLVRIGPTGLFGIVTESEDMGDEGSPAALFIDAAAEHHVGPGRLWVELARQWAAERGIRSLRFDLRGLGDSPPEPATSEQTMYAPTAIDDVVAAAGAADPGDPSNVVLIGLCSGAYAAMDAGMVLRPRGVCAVNPVMSFRPQPFAAGPAPDRPLVHGLRRRITPAMYESLSRWRFRALQLRSVILDRSGRSALPRTMLRRLAKGGTRVLLIAGAQQVTTSLAAPRAGLLPTPTHALEVVAPDDLDHALLAYGARTRVAQLLTDQLDRVRRR